MIPCLGKNTTDDLELLLCHLMCQLLKSSYQIEALLQPTGFNCNKYVSVAMHVSVSLECYYMKRIQDGQYITLLIQNTKVKVLLLVLIALKKKQQPNPKLKTKQNKKQTQNKTNSSSSVHEYLNIFSLCKYWSSKNQICILPGGCKSNLL